MRVMDVVSVTVAASCATLAALHLVIWWKSRDTRAHLWFSMLAAGMAAFTWLALGMMRAGTPDELARMLRLANVPIFVMVVAITQFVRHYLHSTRPWLGTLAWSIRLVTLAVNFSREHGMDYVAIDAVHRVAFLGDTVSVAEGVTSVWHWVGQLSFAFLLWHIVDATWSSWRSGVPESRRRALVVGVPLSIFMLGGPAQAALIFAGVARWPHVEFVPFLGLLATMSYELCRDVLRAAQLTRELQASEAALRESDRRMSMAADAARLGMWIRDLRTGEIWMTDQCRQLFGFPGDVTVTYAALLARLHPDDRADRAAAIQRAIDARASYQSEYRLVLPDGTQRWIAAHGRVETDAAGQPTRILGVCVDISEQRLAERAAHELSGRLINAQEDERRRIARDLHDDLNQRLALLSVDLELLGRNRTDAVQGVRVEQLAEQVRGLSSDVHRLSYQLHPAKLDQLGLVTAARSWCRDVMQQSGVRVELTTEGLPDPVPSEMALALYRILQESLRNVVRHSGASEARVALSADDCRLYMTIADDGRGFDETDAAHRSGLGLVSMDERVRLLKGTLSVHSRPGEGTRVMVAVPLRGAPGPADGASTALGASAAGPA